MDDAERVRGAGRRGDLGGEVDRERGGQARRAGEPLAQRLAGEPLHHQHRRAVVELEHRAHLDDVGVADRGRGAALDREPPARARVGGIVLDPLERARRAVALVARGPHHAHAALAEPLDQAVAAGEHGAGDDLAVRHRASVDVAGAAL